jgi:hypothetical protein
VSACSAMRAPYDSGVLFLGIAAGSLSQWLADPEDGQCPYEHAGGTRQEEGWVTHGAPGQLGIRLKWRHG